MRTVGADKQHIYYLYEQCMKWNRELQQQIDLLVAENKKLSERNDALRETIESVLTEKRASA